MPSASAPFGLRPTFNANSGFPLLALPGSLTSAVTATIAKGSPVKMLATGLLDLAAAGDRILGVFWGCEYADTASGRYVLSPKWTGSAAASGAVAYVVPAENNEFDIQSASISSTIASLGATADIAANGSTENDAATGVSEVVLSATQGTTSAQCVIVGLAPYSDNNWADTYPIYRVRIAEPQLSSMQLGVGI